MARPAKFTSVAAQLRARIDAGTFASGEVLPAERELADLFGVNRLTLRKAVTALVAEGVLSRRPGCGTIVRPRTAHGAQSGSILYVGSTTDHFYQALYEALCREAARAGLAVTAFTPSDAPDAQRQFGRLAASHRKLICVEAYWKRISAIVPPEVRVTRVSGFDSLDQMPRGERPAYAVSTDTYRAAKLAVEYLAGLGHRRIGYVDAGYAVAGDPMLGAVKENRPPYLGFRSGLHECRLEEACVLAVPHKLMTADDFQEPHYRYFAHHLRSLKPIPTAFVCVGDFRAGALLRVLRERRFKVPRDVSVMGIGNTPWALALDPPLTSVCLGEAEMARLALLLNEAEQPDKTRVVRVDPEMVARASTGKANGA